MVVFPNCKINLGLNILQKRADGYHDLETVFLPVGLYEVLEILPSKNKTTLTTTGIYAGNNNDNLCLKAYHLLQKDYSQLPEIRIHLHKAISPGAGMGGGSADGSFTLIMLNKIFNLDIPDHKMYNYALQLGSDCPFFIKNRPSLASGRGEILEDVTLSLTDFVIAIINPGIHISTKEAFSNIQPRTPEKKIKDIIQQPIHTWKDELRNDFEKPVFEKYPEVKKIKEDLYKAGAEYAAMTGSGSTVFGIFRRNIPYRYYSKATYFHKVVSFI